MRFEEKKTLIGRGQPFPLGANRLPNGWNFAVWTECANVTLCLAPLDDPSNIEEIVLNPYKHRTGNIWHIFIPIPNKSLYYGYRVQKFDKQRATSLSYVVFDPYAKLLDAGTEYGRSYWNQKDSTPRLVAIAHENDHFDWEQDRLLHLPKEEMIIYEMHVRGFTKDVSSHVTSPGSYLGVVEKISHLRDLGITAVELLPIQEFNESENHRVGPNGENLYQYWGYSSLNFFSPMQRYAQASSAIQGALEFKVMVKELHKANIEVILDVVFNHTGEGNEYGQTLSFKGLLESGYYIQNGEGEFLNFSGCGNTFNCNHPVVQDLIIDALRYWVLEYHIDGFRFDLASILSRGQDGTPLTNPPLIERISQDPVLSKCKLIAEPWDAVGLYQVGTFFKKSWQSPSPWLEWNDDFRNIVRNFIKGTPGFAGRFATKLSGSQDIYGKDGSPLNTINYVTCHDGFTLHDLVSYNYKHNDNNGEQNRDGMNENDSWNCGEEGETHDMKINRLRERQVKNFFLALMISQGIPMMHMGDEYGHTKKGNNNTWCHDNVLNWFLWDELEESTSFFRYCKELIRFRKTHKVLKRKAFLGKDDIDWHGLLPFEPDWGPSSQFVAFTLKDHEKRDDLYIAFNASPHSLVVHLPCPPIGKTWAKVVDTSSITPHDILDEGRHQKIKSLHITVKSYSSILIRAV